MLATSSLSLMLMLPLLTMILTHPHTTTAQYSDETSIFPNDFWGYNFRSKRLFPHTNNQCSLCFATYDPDSCLKCWNAKSSIIPIYASKKDDDTFSASKRGYEPMLRFQRGSGCGCCYLSRFSNRHCCAVCSMASKRTGKRSADPMTTGVASEKRSGLTSEDCLCCFRYGGYGGEACCARCYEK